MIFPDGVAVASWWTPWPGGGAPGGWMGLLWAAWIGAMIGSCAGVIAARWPRRAEWAWRQEARRILSLPPDAADAPPPSWIRGRSRCDGCGHRIAWWENVPVIAWLALRGRCRACGAAIGAGALLAEIAGAAMMALAWLHGGSVGGTLLLALAVPFWLTGALVDFASLLLPDTTTFPPLVLGLAAAALHHPGSPTPALALAGAALGWSIPTALNLLTRWLRGEEGMGGGDGWALAGFGAWLGPAGVPVILGLAAIGSLIVFAPVILRRRRDPAHPFHLPFGPGLIAVGGALVLAGPHALQTVLHLLLGTGS